jgi:hypothetical protein
MKKALKRRLKGLMKPTKKLLSEHSLENARKV